MPITAARTVHNHVSNDTEKYLIGALTFWRRNYFFNFSTPCKQNVINTGTKYIRFMKQTAF